MSYTELDRYYTDGNTIVLGRELSEHLWREGLSDDQEDAFAQYVNDTFTPWDVLLYCDPYAGGSVYGRMELFEEWVSDLIVCHDDDLEEIFGFKRCAE